MYCINSLTLGETQSGADRHLETKILGTSYRKTDHSRVLLYHENTTLQYGISGVANPLENHSCSMILALCSI